MTSPATLIALAEKVEALSGPDREFDDLISVAAYPANNARVIYAKGRRFYRFAAPGRTSFAVEFGTGVQFGLIRQQRRYTASLDDARTLIPKEWESVGLQRYDSGTWDASLAGNDGHLMAEDPDEFYVNAEAATPALALTAASLRALAQTGETGS